MIALATSKFGGLDILHNNAGVLSGPRFPDSTSEYWTRAIDVNISGVLFGIHYAVPVLRGRGDGGIINTASISGLVPHLIDPVFAATKAAVVNLTRSLAFLKDEAAIRINCVCPGLVRTELETHSSVSLTSTALTEFKCRRAILKGRPALEASEVANAVITLIRNQSINGIAYNILPNEPLELV